MTRNQVMKELIHAWGTDATFRKALFHAWEDSKVEGEVELFIARYFVTFADAIHQALEEKKV